MISCRLIIDYLLYSSPFLIYFCENDIFTQKRTEVIMSEIVIRKIKSEEVQFAMDLALEVFMQFEAPDYPPEGVDTFKKDIVENPTFIENAKKGICPIYGAFDGDKIVALIGYA